MAELKINGSGSLNAGGEYYDYVGISGSGKIAGNLSCKELKISGSGKIDGDVNCDGEIKISGSGAISGSVKAAFISTSGAAMFDKNIKCDNFSISGTGKVLGDVDCKKLNVAGAASLRNVSASEEAVIKGTAKVTGLLNAESVIINLNGSVNISEIGCTKLFVGRRRSNGSNVKVKIMNLTLFEVYKDKGSGNLRAGTIEGDEINLEYTEADTVRGGKVVIGKGCTIGRVEYTETLEVDESSKVTERVKI